MIRFHVRRFMHICVYVHAYTSDMYICTYITTICIRVRIYIRAYIRACVGDCKGSVVWIHQSYSVILHQYMYMMFIWVPRVSFISRFYCITSTRLGPKSVLYIQVLLNSITYAICTYLHKCILFYIITT